MSPERSIAVVIPNWNSLAFLSRCLASLEDQGVGIELMVVDNGSTDGSVEHLESESIPHVALPENAGFAVAANLGARRTEADALLVLNVDTVLEPGCGAALLDALEADERLGGVQPLILQLDEDAGQTPGSGKTPRVYSAGEALTRDGRGYETGAGEVRGAAHLVRREVFGACGAACLLRRELFERVGGFDESYVSFYEDVDLNVRARIAGRAFEIVPEAIVWHVGNAVWKSQFSRPGADNARLVARNRLVTQAKFMPASALPRIAAVEAGALAKAALERRFRATAAGKLEGLRRLPEARRERRRLRDGGDLGRVQEWLGRK